MTDSRIQQGAFVRHDRYGVGRVAERDISGGVTIDFKTGESQQLNVSVARNLKVLPHNGLEALTWEGPEEIRSWITEAPLKLIAAAIADISDTPKIGEIKNALQGQGKVFDDEVKLSTSWWNRVRQAAAADSRHFLAVRNKSNSITAIRLIGDVDNVPDGQLPPLPPKVKPAFLWKKWLNGETPDPPALKRPLMPPKSVSNDLAKWPSASIDKALHQTMRGVEDFLWSDSNSSQAAAAWLEALSRASMRLIECTWPDSDKHLTERTAELIERLSEYISPSGLSLFLSGALSGQLDEQRSMSYEERLEQQRQEQECQRADYENRLEQQRQERERLDKELKSEKQERERLDKELKSEKQERERLDKELKSEKQERERVSEELKDEKKKVQDLDAELDAKREMANLEIRRDMLLAVGEILQSLRHQNSIEELVGDVEAGMILALRAGSAEPLETYGTLVDYKPQWHNAIGTPLDSDTKVKVVAPGVIARGGAMGDRVLLKAQVKHEAI